MHVQKGLKSPLNDDFFGFSFYCHLNLPTLLKQAFPVILYRLERDFVNGQAWNGKADFPPKCIRNK
jgi:hypothetical protein